MKKIKLIETYDNCNSISLTEDIALSESKDKQSRVDGKYIIGMIEGQFFQPDGMSRNQRWYPRSLWEKALNCADVKNRFLTSTMFGEIGHSEGPVEDLTLRNGCASHFIDEMWIDEKGRGMGRAYILNTPTGNLLKTYLGAGCKLKVSTRGEGLYKEHETYKGCPIVDDDTYELQTADFVLNPGFLETSAVLREQYENIDTEIKNNTTTIKETMAYIRQKGENRMTLDMNAYVQELKEELKSLKEENKSLNEELKAKSSELLKKQVDENAEIKKLNEAYAPFKKMKVSAKTLTESFKRSQTLLKEAKAENVSLKEELQAFKAECGSLEELKESTKLATRTIKMLQEYKKLGSVKEIEKLAEVAQRSLKEIKECRGIEKKARSLMKSLDEAKALKAVAEKANKTLREYVKTVGSLQEAKKLVSCVEKFVSKNQPKVAKRTTVKESMKLSKKFGCTVESASKLLKKYGSEKAGKLLEQAVASKKVVSDKMKSGKALVEEVAQLDKNPKIETEKTAKDFLSVGMIKNNFNADALGKKMDLKDLNDIDGTVAQKPNAAKELLKKYSGAFDVEPCNATINKEMKPADAEKEANKLLKK